MNSVKYKLDGCTVKQIEEISIITWLINRREFMFLCGYPVAGLLTDFWALCAIPTSSPNGICEEKNLETDIADLYL